MGKTINQIRGAYGLEPVRGGDDILINKIKNCNEKCGNYLVIKFERLNSNNICSECKMKDSKGIKELLKLNIEADKYKREVKEGVNEVY